MGGGGSVAIVMWELLTGLIPWKGMDIVQIIQQVVRRPRERERERIRERERERV